VPGEDKPFKVTDRRAVSEDGTPKQTEPEAPPSPETAGPVEAKTGSSPEEDIGRAPEEDIGRAPEEEIDFTTFLISLAANAMHHLGEGPEGKPALPNLPLARQTIDIIALLQDKTRGNLSGDEERLLESILYDLRMRFVVAARR